jgi:hypothetical protein
MKIESEVQFRGALLLAIWSWQNGKHQLGKIAKQTTFHTYIPEESSHKPEKLNGIN